jgi:hypothetical protein
MVTTFSIFSAFMRENLSKRQDDVPDERNEERAPRKLERKRLTLYGEWIEQLCVYLEVTPTSVARRAGLHHTTIGKVTREGTHTNGPGRYTILVICQAMQDIAKEKRKPWQGEWETMMHNAAGQATFSQIMEAKHGLDTIPVVRRTRKRK